MRTCACPHEAKEEDTLQSKPSGKGLTYGVDKVCVTDRDSEEEEVLGAQVASQSLGLRPGDSSTLK